MEKNTGPAHWVFTLEIEVPGEDSYNLNNGEIHGVHSSFTAASILFFLRKRLRSQ